MGAWGRRAQQRRAGARLRRSASASRRSCGCGARTRMRTRAHSRSRSRSRALARRSTPAKFLILSMMPARTSSMSMHVASPSVPKRMITTRSSSLRMAWSTSQPLARCGMR